MDQERWVDKTIKKTKKLAIKLVADEMEDCSF